MRFLLSLSLALLVAHNCAWAKDTNYPGGLAILTFDKRSNKIPLVRYGTQEPAIVDAGKQWKVYIGIGLDHLPGEYLVYYRDQEPESEASFHRFLVKQVKFMTKPDIDTPLPIPKFPNSLSDLGFENTTPFLLPFSLPISAQWDGDFGSYLIGDSSNAIHQQDFSYIDVGANTEIMSPSTGIVSRIVKSEGNEKYSLTIDHGSGLFSIFNGLGSISVKLGHGLSRGEVFAYSPPSPKSGERAPKPRTSKEHTIIWRTKLNNELINPLILTKTGEI